MNSYWAHWSVSTQAQAGMHRGELRWSGRVSGRQINNEVPGPEEVVNSSKEKDRQVKCG